MSATFPSKRLKSCVRFVSGGTPSKEVLAYWQGSIPWVSPKDMKVDVISDTEDHISEAAVEDSATTLVPARTVLVVVRSGILRHSLPVAVTSRPMTINQDIKALVPVRDLDATYLAWQIRGRANRLRSEWSKEGTTVESIEQALMGNSLALIPELHQQRRIAAFLDRETKRIDDLITKKQRLVALIAEQQQGIVTKAITEGVNSQAVLRTTSLPWMPKVALHWPVVELRHLAKFGTSITYGIVQAGPHIEGGVPYIRTGDMSGDKLPTTGYQCTTPEIAASYRKSKIEAGDIVIAIRATLGKALPVPPHLGGANLTQGTAKFSPGPRLDSEFALYAIRSLPVQQRIDAVAKGATFREITLEMLRRLPIPVPPIEEQRVIVQHIRKYEAHSQVLTEATTRAISLLTEYRSALITAAVTGHLDVTKAAPPLPSEASA